ncbi:fructosamine kinase family protein [Gracilimonas mengyeensis]|uniref:Fructosamine-3-kinase n=1 Tax=Gracilimonas mengyeensis TaxID=1302730 RepID=A0A521ELU1_9BACT|nr:fructosamine kinase family protein [Gracilimonas mengyeensis]SMO84887.1 Fructosamine-3-kinase [Gracilimonas mengyeensis]
MLPESIKSRIQKEFNVAIRSEKGIYGGDINEAAKVQLEDDRTFFVKWNSDAPRGMFEAEAEGLELLKNAGTQLEVPVVKLTAENFLVLDWIEEGGGRQNSSYEFGQELAKMHKNTDDQFGLNHDNFIGKLPQSNTRHSNWADFFAIERIEPQVKMGVESGKLTRSILRTVEKMYTKLGSIFPTEKPALIHGDLWSGNYMFTKSGNASIYDPAVYYGHREMEMAMTRLFGGFSANFYEGYNEVYPLDSGFDDRVTLCNLYPILVHANLFGGSYCRQAENIINSYG